MGGRKLTRTAIILGLAHVACTAVGLGWFYRSTCAATYATLERQAFASLEGATRRMIGSASSPQLADLEARLTARMNDGPASAHDDIGFLLVDAQWRVLASDRNEKLGPVTAWAAENQDAGGGEKSRLGRICLPDGRHLAAASPLDHETGHLIAHIPESSLADSLSSLTSPLPAMALLTLVWSCVPVGILIYMVVRSWQEGMNQERQAAQADAMRQTYELVRTRDAIIVGLAKLAESRDPETGDHLERIAAYSTLLAASLAEHPRFRDQITPTFIKLIGGSSVLHDIGKVGVPDNILLKRGPLTDSERAVMQLHSGVGGQCLREIERKMGSSSYLKMAREIALHHHERWDGSGYPQGLSGEDIPLAARIVALADVYDALSTRRVYKAAIPHERCVAIIREESGCHFDPHIVDVWVTIEGQYQDIARRYAATRDKPGDEQDVTTLDSAKDRVLTTAGAETWR